MERKDFLKYRDLIKKPKVFSLYPEPKGPDPKLRWCVNEFLYVDDNLTHIKIQHLETDNIYDLPLALVEFISPGVMRLTRQVEPWNHSFV